MKEEKKLRLNSTMTLLKLKSREVDLRAMENERKKQNDEAQQDLNRAKLMQAKKILKISLNKTKI